MARHDDDAERAKAERDAERERKWAEAKKDIERHDREFEKKHGKGGKK